MFHLLRLREPAYFYVSKFKCRRLASNANVGNENKGIEAEKRFLQILKQRFSKADEIRVTDVSGGCGAMFNIMVISPEFKDVSIVKQHRMVTDVLKDEIKEIHGLRIFTSHEPASEDSS